MIDYGKGKEIIYRGLTLRWTGWKPYGHSTTCLAGQWVTQLREGGPYLFASVPGSEGEYWPGYVFDTSIHEGQKVVDLAMTLNEMKVERDAGLERLKRLVDEWLR
jgi:hypothetical protein